MPGPNEYQVEGYGERKPYDSDYHPSAEIDPSVHYAFGGNPELQEKWQKDLEKLQDAKLKAEKKHKPANRPPQEPEVLGIQRGKTAENLVQQAQAEKAAAEADVRADEAGDKTYKKEVKKRTAKKTTAKKTAVKKA